MIALGKCVVYVRVHAMLMDGMTSLMWSALGRVKVMSGRLADMYHKCEQTDYSGFSGLGV